MNKSRKKLDLIEKQLNKIKMRKEAHFHQFMTLKRLNSIFKAVVNALNTVSVTGLVLNFSGHPISLYISTTTSTLSAVATAILSVANLESKFHSHQTSYLQLIDLYDTINAALVKENVSPSDLDDLLGQMNTRMNIILDTCEPIVFAGHGLDSPKVARRSYFLEDDPHELPSIV
jgi:hypothetical protein